MVGLLAFLWGLLLGWNLRVLLVWYRAPRVTAVAKDEPLFPFRMPWQPKKKIEATKPAIHALPRSSGGWRRQRRELEREHNSKQKERDQRLAAL